MDGTKIWLRLLILIFIIGLIPISLGLGGQGCNRWEEVAYDTGSSGDDGTHYGPLNAPSDLTANAVSDFQINLSWTDNSDNEDGFKIERKTGAGGTYAQIAAVGTNITSYPNIDLAASTTYYYRVRAYNLSGDSAYSNQASATTLDPVAPWDKIWGGTLVDQASAVAVDSAGNIYLTGDTQSYGQGAYDILFLKYNSSGTLLWEKTWGGTGNDRAAGIALDSSGNIYLAGYTASFGAGGNDVLLLKYNSTGTLQWQKTWGGVGNEAIGLTGPGSGTGGIVIDSNNNIYLAGMTSSWGAGGNDVLLLKYNSAGTLLWQKIWGGTNNDMTAGIALDSSGNVFLSGTTLGFGAGSADTLLLKYNSAGTLVMEKTWGGTGNDRTHAIALDSSGNIYLAGLTSSFGVGSIDVLLLKYNSSGTLQWEKTWGGTGGERVFSIGLDSSGNIYLAGMTASFGGGGNDVLLLKYNSAGALVMEKTWGGTMNNIAKGMAVTSSAVFLAGYTSDPTATWQTVSGTAGSPTGTETTPGGAAANVTGNQGTATGIETFPSGSAGGGAGQNDILFLRTTK